MSNIESKNLFPWVDNNRLTFRPDVAEKLGAHRINDPIMAALVMEQLRIWELSEYGYKDEDGNLWQLPTVEDWEAVSGRTFSPWRVRDILSKLEQLGYLIREKFCKLCDSITSPPENLRGDNHTKFIRLNWQRLTGLFGGADEAVEESVAPITADGSRSDQISDPELIKSDLISDQEQTTLKPESLEPEDEQAQLMGEVKSVTGKLTPQLQKLVIETAPEVLRAALGRYPGNADIKKPCSYLMTIIKQLKDEQFASPKRASEATDEEIRRWFRGACQKGRICHEEADYDRGLLPKKNNVLCCRVPVPVSDHPMQLPYDLRPLVELMREWG